MDPARLKLRVGTPVEQVELADGCAAEAIDHECDVITSPEREITGNRLDEFVELAFDPRGDDLLQQGGDGKWRLLVGRGMTPADQPEGLPVAFSLIATKV